MDRKYECDKKYYDHHGSTSRSWNDQSTSTTIERRHDYFNENLRNKKSSHRTNLFENEDENDRQNPNNKILADPNDIITFQRLNKKEETSSVSGDSDLNSRPKLNSRHHRKMREQQTLSKVMNHTKNNQNIEKDSTNERLDRLESLLETLIKNQDSNKRSNNHQGNISVSNESQSAFILDPRRPNFTTSMWINKIEEIAIEHNWSETKIIPYMESQLCGLLKAWYSTISHLHYSWTELKLLISKSFPDNVDFVMNLKRLVTRIRLSGETVVHYYFCKMYLLEMCKISGENAVLCLIDGLNNQQIQKRAREENFLNPETFYNQLILNLPDYEVDFGPPSYNYSGKHENLEITNHHNSPPAQIHQHQNYYHDLNYLNNMDIQHIPGVLPNSIQTNIDLRDDLVTNAHYDDDLMSTNNNESIIEPAIKQRLGTVHDRLDKPIKNRSKHSMNSDKKIACYKCNSANHSTRQCGYKK